MASFVPPVPIGQGAGWVPEPVWTLWSREILLAPVRNPAPAVHAVACLYTD
jgi:hypothetical protein